MPRYVVPLAWEKWAGAILWGFAPPGSLRFSAHEKLMPSSPGTLIPGQARDRQGRARQGA